jgi:hypothetical protein
MKKKEQTRTTWAISTKESRKAGRPKKSGKKKVKKAKRGK